MSAEVEQALAVIRGAAKSAKARAAVSVLETELQVGGKGSAGDKASGKPQGFPTSKNADARMSAMKSARGAATA